MKNPKYYRIIVTYNGFSEVKDAAVVRAAGRGPSQEGYDPVEAKRTIDFVFGSMVTAAKARGRLLKEQEQTGKFSVSKVIDDNF